METTPSTDPVTVTSGSPLPTFEELEAERLAAEDKAKADAQAEIDTEAARVAQEEADKAEAQRLADEETARVAALAEQAEKDRLSAIPAPAPIEGSVFKVQAGVNFSVDGPGGNVSPL